MYLGTYARVTGRTSDPALARERNFARNRVTVPAARGSEQTGAIRGLVDFT